MIPIPIQIVRLLQFQVTLCTFLSAIQRAFFYGSILDVPIRNTPFGSDHIYFLCSKIPEGIEIKGNESTALSDDVTTQCYLELQTGKFSRYSDQYVQ